MLLTHTLLFWIGACWGSWLTCMAERLSANQSLWRQPRSACPVCHHQLRAWQLIPLVGAAVQGWRCHDCHKPISWYSTLLEALCGWLLMISWHAPNQIPLLMLGAYAVLLFNSLTDYLTFDVYPSTLLLPGGLGLLWHPLTLNAAFLSLIGLLVGLSLCALFTNRFGLGDVDVLLMLSTLAPPAVVIESLLLATLAALLIIVSRRTPGPLPFVPFITWGFILCTLAP